MCKSKYTIYILELKLGKISLRSSHGSEDKRSDNVASAWFWLDLIRGLILLGLKEREITSKVTLHLRYWTISGYLDKL